MLFALSQCWNDFLTIGGFLVGVISLVLGGVAFYYTLLALWEARDAAKASKTAAEAARDAAEKTFAETKDNYERFVADHAGRLLTELRGAVNGRIWTIAALRARDLAGMFATLPTTGVPSEDATMQEDIATLREFDYTFTELAGKEAGKLSLKVLRDQWRPLLRNLDNKLDRLRAPLRREQHGQNDSGSPVGESSGDRQRPLEQNQSGSGELGTEGNE